MTHAALTLGRLDRSPHSHLKWLQKITLDDCDWVALLITIAGRHPGQERGRPLPPRDRPPPLAIRVPRLHPTALPNAHVAHERTARPL